MIKRSCLCVFSFTAFLCGLATSVRMLEMVVPAQVMLGERATLQCIFDMEGEELYSVKWYKAGHEFFRYIPGDRDQRITTFNLPGITVEKSQSDSSHVILRNVNLGSTGRYRCEVSAEAPLFNTVSQSKRMQVVALPKAGPRISGGSPLYRLGDRVKVNCTSDSSHPAADLKWFINGKLADPHHLRHYPFIQHENGLQTAILGLEFEVFRPHLYGTSLELDLRCTSGLSARVTNPENPHKILEHHHQEVARLRSAGSLIPSGCVSMTHSLRLTLLSHIILSHLLLNTTRLV